MNDSHYATHAQAELTHWWFMGRRSILQTLIEDILPPSADRLVIDVGCATGGSTAALSERYQTLGIDPSQDAIRWARERFPEVRFICGEAPDDLDGLAERADLFLLTDVLEHVCDDFLLFSRLLAVARPGAHFVVTVPADMWLWGLHDESHGHFRRYNRHRPVRLWEGLPVTPRLVSNFNSRLYAAIRIVRAINRLRGRSHGAAGTDLNTPSCVTNRIMTWILSGEAKRLVGLLHGRRRGYRNGVSLIAVLRREEGIVLPRRKPADLAPDAFAPVASRQSKQAVP